MERVTLNPYLFFAGNCREAMEFYRDVFGGTLNVQTYDEVPGQQSETHPSKLAGRPVDAMKGKVMHASLMNGEVDLMASDSPYPDRLGTGKISLSLSGTDNQKLRTIFDSLSAGGRVNYPLKTESWGDVFGTLTDKFGAEWMVNISARKA